MRTRELAPSRERIESAQRLAVGLRVKFTGDKRDLANRTGVIVRPGYGENVHGYVPLWRVSFDNLRGEYACWHDELSVVV